MDFLCVSAFALCMCVVRCACMCVSHWLTGVFLSDSLTYLLRQGLLMEARLINTASLASQLAPGVACL